jgi:DNA uptake protein ComE-like DNA-binding protein
MQSSKSSKVNLNTASSEDLVSVIPGISRDKIQELMSHRPFRSWDDVSKVPGFSRDMIDNLKRNTTI